MKLAELIEAEEGDLGDLIISKFEIGKITYEQALEEFKKGLHQ